MTQLWCHDENEGPRRRVIVGLLALLWAPAVQPFAAALGQTPYSGEKTPVEKKAGSTRIIPSVTLTERYDSNILYAPSGLNVGREKWDFVTSLIPSIQLLNKNRYVETTLTAGANGSRFINNDDLNFISTFATGVANLDGLVNRVVRGGKLQIADTFSYSPENPSFVNAAAQGETNNPFARGLVPIRANTYQNSAAIRGTYPISSAVSLQGEYDYSLMRFENIFVAEEPGNVLPVAFFNTDYHTWSVGPSWRVGRSDQLGVAYKSTTIKLRDTVGLFGDVDFTSRGAEALYSTRMGDWAASASAGATLLEDRVYYTGALTLSAKAGEATQVQVMGSRQMAPAFFGIAGALISTTAGLSVEHKFDKSLSLTGSANYAYNALAPVKLASFESYAASAVLAYKLSRSVTTSVQYSYTYFGVTSLDAVTQNISGYLVNRHFVLFSITATWN